MKKYILLLSLLLAVGCSNNKVNNEVQTPLDYTLEQAEKNGDIIVGPSGQRNTEKMDDFITSHNNNEKATLRIATYTDEGDAILYDLSTDEDTIYYSSDNTRDAFGGDVGIKKTACKNIVKEEDTETTLYIIEGCKDRIGPYDSVRDIDIVLTLVK